MKPNSRLHPTWWDHQRHSLVRLSVEVDRLVTTRLARHTGTVVDLGCGAMPYRPLFETRGFRYIGCDIDPSAPVPITPGQPVPLADGSAAAVVSFQVLEHVWDLDWYLGECRRLLHPDGHLLLSTHGNWLYHPHPTDFRRWTRDGLCSELETRGFIVEQMAAIMGPLAWTTQFRLLGYREVLRRTPILRSTLLPALIVAMNLRMEIEDAITPASIRETNASIYAVVARPARRSATA
jgi:SAM-dependent methyltransferase